MTRATGAAGRGRQVHWYHPGEVVVAVELPPDAQPSAAQGAVRRALERRLAGRAGGVFHPVQSRPEPIVFAAPNRPRLAFLFYDLEERASPAAVKRVVSAIHGQDLEGLASIRRGALRAVAATPHWLALAQQACIGGSPGSLPRPIRRDELPDGAGPWRYAYAPLGRGWDRRARADRLPGRARVPVAVLDTAPDGRHLRAQARRFGELNAQLAELTSALGGTDPAPGPHADRLAQLQRQHWRIWPAPATGVPPACDLADHGLFVAGLVRAVAPRAPLSLIPVLASHGVGDLELLLRALARVTQAKDPAAPLVINLSLGLLPQLERLPFVWYGLPRPHDPGHVHDPAMQTDDRDARWLREHREEARRSLELLHAPLERLATYLVESNCLVVAAAGNDSLERVEEGQPRLEPRIPARYATVLGVAATSRRPERGARYSNVGDAWELGDHVATFGGEVASDGEPEDGVIGVYTAPYLPDRRSGRPSRSLPNETGWVRWSGTSFATGIVSGVAANYWASERGRGGSPEARQVLYELALRASDYAAALRTPAIALTGGWQPA